LISEILESLLVSQLDWTQPHSRLWANGIFFLTFHVCRNGSLKKDSESKYLKTGAAALIAVKRIPRR